MFYPFLLIGIEYRSLPLVYMVELIEMYIYIYIKS
jgi:hypothetical protein